MGYLYIAIRLRISLFGFLRFATGPDLTLELAAFEIVHPEILVRYTYFNKNENLGKFATGPQETRNQLCFYSGICAHETRNTIHQLTVWLG